MPPKNRSNSKEKNPKKEAYRLGAPRGDQKFEVANKIKAKRGGGEEWRQWSRSQLAQKQVLIALFFLCFAHLFKRTQAQILFSHY
jgi:hypothetical protein